MKKALKISFGTLLFLVLCGAHCKSVAKAPAAGISISYSEAANIYEIMDNTSFWWEGYSNDAYQKYWKKRFGRLSEKDLALFEQYKALRERYFKAREWNRNDPMSDPDGFFVSSGSGDEDPLSKIFYRAQDLEEAFENLSSLLSEKEIDFLRSFYSHFSPKYEQILKESVAFRILAKTAKQQLNEEVAKDVLKKAQRFYGVEQRQPYRALLVWWPPISYTNATPLGEFLLLRFHPVEHVPIDNSEIILHEIMHTYSESMSQEKKQKMTRLFLEHCTPPKDLGFFDALEEPLAVAIGQIAYQKQVNPVEFNMGKNWYQSTWIDQMARKIFPLVEEYLNQGKTMDVSFVKKSAKHCQNLRNSL